MAPKAMAALVLLSVFTLGAVAGIFVHGHLGAPLHGLRPAETSTTQLHEEAMEELRATLQLSDEQVTAIESIMAHRQEIVQTMWERLRPEVQEAMQEVHEEIAALLTTEQRQRFHEWLLQQRQRHETQLH